MVQFNTAYAATPLLTAFLRREGIDAHQADLSLDLALKLFSRDGLRRALAAMRAAARKPAGTAAFLLDHARAYLASVDVAVAYLQTRSPALAAQVLAPDFLPRGPRFRVLEDWRAFGLDPAQTDPDGYPLLLASLYLDDLSDAIRQGVDPRFGLSRYAERLSASASSFAALRRALHAPPGVVGGMLDGLTRRLLERVQPDVVGLTLPFPGALYGGLRVALGVRRWRRSVPIVAGGGFVNTELRSLADPAIFDVIDYFTYDDGEIPLLRLIRHLAGGAGRETLVRTRCREAGRVVYADAPAAPLRHRDRPAPCYDGLALARYCQVIETPNPMNRLWTERKWLKLQLAHGCYWHRCAFCDTRLDYIARFDPADADTALGWIREMVRATGLNGFHFVDEAAPPALLRRLSQRLNATGTLIKWWTNVRFDKAFTPALALELAKAGCVAVTGGIECAEDELLARMRKGVTLREMARVTHGLAKAGILVHAYLMYGFPGQTVQQTMDALEFVRQLFAAGCVQSAFWHRFALTVHSEVRRTPGRFGVRVPVGWPVRFAENDVPFDDRTGVDHEVLGAALNKATYNYMHGIAIDEDVRFWVAGHAPAPRLARGTVRRWIRGI